MCIRSHSESGQPCGFVPCEAYKRLEEENAALRQDRDRLAGIVEKADALAEAIKIVPGFMSVVSRVIQDVWQRYRVNDSGLSFNPDEVAGNVEEAAKSYQEVRHVK